MLNGSTYKPLLFLAGIPQCHWHGQHEGFDCIVIDLLGPNLNQIKEVTKNFSINAIVYFGVQIVSSGGLLLFL